MLSPNVVEASEDIAASCSQFLALRSFSRSGGQIVVSPLSPDPAWLTPFRQRLASLAKTCSTWQLDSPDIIANYYLPFTNYSTSFGAFARQSSEFGNDVDLWVQALRALHENITKGRDKASSSAKSFTEHLRQIKIVEGQLDENLITAWSELATEEKQMVALAEQITRLQDRVSQLQDNLTSAELSSGKSYFSTAATISYEILTAASVEIPYLSIVVEIYTIGKMAYDLIVTDKEISDALSQIAELTVKATEAAQAAAMSKAVIQLINRLDVQVTGLNDRLPALDRMWENEAEKLSAAIDSIQSGAKPTRVLDLVSMPSAAAVWETLAKLSRNAVAPPSIPGAPVFITTAPTRSTQARFSATRT